MGFIKGLFYGAVAGAVLGVLFAPDKGSVTRKNLSRKKDEYTGNLKKTYETLSETADRVKSTVNDVKDSFTGRSSGSSGYSGS